MSLFTRCILYSLFSLLLSACSTDTMEDYTLLYDITAPNQATKIAIHSKASFAFGPHQIKVFLHQQDQKQLVLDTKLYNDGANLRHQNVVVEWQEGKQVLLRLNGQEQEEVVYQLDYMNFEAVQVQVLE